MSEIDPETSARSSAPPLIEHAEDSAEQDEAVPRRDMAGWNNDAAPENADEADNGVTRAATPEVADPHPQVPAPTATPPEADQPQEAPAPDEVVALTELPANQTLPPAAEVELKLLVDADRLAEFNALPDIADHARNTGTRKHLKAVYYDTPQQILRQNGLSLRVRQHGQRFVQTVKAESGGDPLRRGEWEASVSSIAPDVDLAMPFVPAKLRDALRCQPLQPVFISDIHRLQRIVDLPAGSVEVAFDRGVLRSGKRSMPVSEIELELKEGSSSAIYDLALKLADHGPVRPSIRSKAARGFDLASDTPPPVNKPSKLDVDPSLPLDDAFAAILGSCLRDLLVSVPAAEDGRDPEGVHQVRVALRRLRSTLDSMATVVTSETLEALREDARWLAATLSAARTWDIFQGETLPAVAGSCAAIAGFDILGEGAEQRRLAAYDDARLALADARSTRFVIRLGGWIEVRGWRDDMGPESLPLLAEPAFSFARRVLSVHHAKVLKRGRHFKSMTAAERHRLRLSVKKLRYVADFLLPLCTDRKTAKQFTGRLAGLQDELGAFNDMATTGSLLASLVAASADSGAAAAAIAGWQAHAMVGAEARLRDAWRDFAKTRPPWSAPGVV